MELVGKKSNLESGYVFVPYIIQTSNPIIIDGNLKQNIRRMKINKIYKLNREIKDSQFSPKMSVKSRYSVTSVNSKFFGKIEIKNPL
jgi:hypothetical protein